MPNTPEPLVADLQHVSVARDNSVVLHDLSLQIASGERVAILGPNGCGKSTLIKTLTRELYPVVLPGASVRLFGRERWDVTELRRRLGVVSSEPPVRDALSVSGLEAVLTGFFSSARIWPNLQVTGVMRDLASTALEEVGAAHLRDRPLGAMSSGQQKRVLIARALVGSGNGEGRRVLLLDEPSNALDLAAQRELRQVMRHQALAGTGLILVTHHVEDIVPEVNRVILMQDGRIVATGPKQSLLTTERLSQIFATDVKVREEDGTYFAW